MKETATDPHPTTEMTFFGRRVPARPLITNPASGSSGISQMYSIMSPLQQVDLVHIGRATPAEQGDDDRQADRGLRRGHCHDKECEELPVHRAERSRAAHEREIRRVEHQLDAHED